MWQVCCEWAVAGTGGKAVTDAPLPVAPATCAGESSRPGSASTPSTACGSLGSSVAALQEARQAHEAAASDVAQANASCLEQDRAIEQLELQQQRLLVRPDRASTDSAAGRACCACELDNTCPLPCL